MSKKLLAFWALVCTSFFLNAQCGPSYSDNANFDNAGSSIGISFTTDASCGGTLTSITFNAGFTVFPASPTNTIGYATVRLYEGNGLAGNVLGTLNNVELNSTDTFNFAPLMITMNASSQYTIIVSDFTLITSTGRGFNTPWVPPYTGGSLYRDGVEQPGQHLAFSVNIDDSTLSTTEVALQETEVHVYPNPATNVIQLTALKQEETYTILDISGRKMTQGTWKPNAYINVEKFRRGMYFIQLEKKVLKFIKK